MANIFMTGEHPTDLVDYTLLLALVCLRDFGVVRGRLQEFLGDLVADLVPLTPSFYPVWSGNWICLNSQRFATQTQGSQ